MIVITGATGQLGAEIVERLLDHVDADQVGVSVRDPARAAALEQRGVRVRRGDFTDPGSLASAFAGASKVLVVSVDVLGAEGVAQSIAAIDAGYRAGAERVLYTSHQAAAAESRFAPARDHAAVEAHLADLGRPHTALRNGYYTRSLGFHLGDTMQTGELIAPADGPVNWTAPDDLADAAAAILAGETGFDGPTPPLVGSAAVDLEQVAETLSQLSGRPIRRVVLDDDAYVERLRARGMPEAFARLTLDSWAAARDGEFAVEDRTLAELIGRDPQSLRSALQAVAS